MKSLTTTIAFLFITFLGISQNSKSKIKTEQILGTYELNKLPNDSSVIYDYIKIKKNTENKFECFRVFKLKGDMSQETTQIYEVISLTNESIEIGYERNKASYFFKQNPQGIYEFSVFDDILTYCKK